MKTFLVYDEVTVEDHGGEEYDEIIEVNRIPTVETIQDWANRIKSRIRKLWVEGKGDDERGVVVTLDSSAPYKAMLINLQIFMKAEEEIEIELIGCEQRDEEEL